MSKFVAKVLYGRGLNLTGNYRKIQHRLTLLEKRYLNLRKLVK
jgi:hypothetical protein